MSDAMTAWGADVEALTTLAKDLHRSADEFDADLGAMLRQLERLDWFGPDADRFRHEAERHRSGVHANVVGSLRAASDALRRNADEQTAASGADATVESVTEAKGQSINASLMVGSSAVVSAGYSLTRSAESSISTALSPEGAAFEQSARLGLEARAQANVGYESRYLNADADVYVAALAEAEEHIHGHVGLDGIVATAGASAFIGGEVGGDAHVDLAGVDVGAHGAITYGIGAHADASLALTATEVRLRADFGFAVGFGGSGSIDLTLHPEELMANAGNLLDGAEEWLGGGVEQVGDGFDAAMEMVDSWLPW